MTVSELMAASTRALGSVDDYETIADRIDGPKGCSATTEESQDHGQSLAKVGLSVSTFCSFRIVIVVAVVGRSGGYRG